MRTHFYGQSLYKPPTSYQIQRRLHTLLGTVSNPAEDWYRSQYSCFGIIFVRLLLTTNMRLIRNLSG